MGTRRGLSMAPSQVALGLLEARADPSVCETSALGYGRKSPEGATPKVGAPSACASPRTWPATAIVTP